MIKYLLLEIEVRHKICVHSSSSQNLLTNLTSRANRDTTRLANHLFKNKKTVLHTALRSSWIFLDFRKSVFTLRISRSCLIVGADHINEGTMFEISVSTHCSEIGCKWLSSSHNMPKSFLM